MQAASIRVTVDTMHTAETVKSWALLVQGAQRYWINLETGVREEYRAKIPLGLHASTHTAMTSFPDVYDALPKD